MSQERSTDKQIRMNAPTYMRPQRSVLDEPLDIDGGKHVVAQPAKAEAYKTVATEPTEVTLEVPPVMVEPPATIEPETVEAVPPTNVSAVEETAPVQSQEVQTAVEPEAETPVEQTTISEPVKEPRRKQMTVFQQMIVFLLLLVVAASLATVLLYTKGWIELPPAVLEVVEKGLALIQ